MATNARMINAYAVLNLLWAAICLIWVAIVAAVLVYGVFYSGDTPEEITAGVLGSLFIGLPGFLGLLVFVVAGIGLLRRSIWGYYAHIIGAILAVFSCLGIVYTVFAIMHAWRPEFRNAFP